MPIMFDMQACDMQPCLPGAEQEKVFKNAGTTTTVCSCKKLPGDLSVMSACSELNIEVEIINT